MKLLIATGLGEPRYSSNKGLIHAFKKLGIETWVVGPKYWDRGEEEADVLFDDRPYPEKWTYKEVLDVCPWTPDFIFQIAPHFWLHGEKPKGIKSGFYDTDYHCSGAMNKQGAMWGQFDYLFVCPPSYLHFFQGLAPNVHVILPAFDERRFDKNINNEPECDIAFVGQSGLNTQVFSPFDSTGPYTKKDNIGCYVDRMCDWLPQNELKYSGSKPSYDYAERGELLYRLSRDFDVRIYEPLWDERLQLAIQKGRIGFNRSLLNDLSIRNWEVAASGRPLVTDHVQFLGLPFFPECSVLYRAGFYKPFYPNFDLEYEECKFQVNSALDIVSKMPDWTLHSQERVFQNDTWTCRAKQILEIIGA